MRVQTHQPMSEADKLLARSVVGKDGGPPKPSRVIDLTDRVRCERCGAHFVRVDNHSAEVALQAHTENKHAPKPRRTP